MAYKSVIFNVQKDFSLSPKPDLFPGRLLQPLFLLPALIKRTSLPLYTHVLGFKSTSPAQLLPQPYVQRASHHL